MHDSSGLPARLYGTHIGDLVRADGGALLIWSAEAVDRWGLNSPILSRNLRVGTSDVESTESFFGALLPEGRHLQTLATAVKTSSSDLVGMLAAVGADLAGALQVGEPAEARPPEELTEDQIAVLLSSASGFLVGGGGSALPGFQRKLTLTRDGDRWIRGNGTLPSTHILKPVQPEFRSAVDAEFYTLHLAARQGLVTFDSWVEVIAGSPTLVVGRYDRVRSGERIERVHQEDMGQALGLPWGGNDKFEQNNPVTSFRNMAALLDTRGSALIGTPDRLRLLRFATFNAAVGNTDAHAKNYSLLHSADGRTTLAPLYDAAPLGLDYTNANGTALSMRINGKYQVPDLTMHDLIAEGASWGILYSEADDAVRATLESLTEDTRTIVAPASIESHVPGYIRGQAQNLLDGMPARIDSAIPLQALPRLGTPHERG